MAGGLLQIVAYGAADVLLAADDRNIDTRFPRSTRRGAARHWEALVRLQIAGKFSGRGIDVADEIREASTVAQGVPELPSWLFKAGRPDPQHLKSLYRVITGEQPIMHHNDVTLQLRLSYQAVACICWAWQKLLAIM